MPLVRARGRFADMTAAMVAPLGVGLRCNCSVEVGECGGRRRLDAFLPHYLVIAGVLVECRNCKSL
jgi:hypothetical protein